MSVQLNVLVIGATSSIGRLVVAESLRRGHRIRALVRSATDVRFPDGTDIVEGNLTSVESLKSAVDGVDAVVFTHGSHGGSADAERVDYGAVRNTIEAIGDKPTRIALMTAIGVTVHSPGHDWKRRGERLVRATGWPYTIVRPGWFDYNGADQLSLQFLQGDLRRAGDPSDGAISRDQIAEVLISSLTSATADKKTFELVAEHGPASTDLEELFADLASDVPGSLDAVEDMENMPFDSEPADVVAFTKHLLGARQGAKFGMSGSTVLSLLIGQSVAQRSQLNFWIDVRVSPQ